MLVNIKSTDEIYPALNHAFEQATKPMTVADLMMIPDVFSVAMARWGNDKVKASEKLSDTLGFMWRKGVLDRFPAPPSISMARYAYALRGQLDDQGEKIPPAMTKHRGDINIVEKDGEVILELKDFTIVIKPK